MKYNGYDTYIKGLISIPKAAKGTKP